MTREEAIENLKEFIDTYITCHGEEDTVAVSIDNVDVEALDMAIEALEQLTSYEQTINKLTKAISEQEPKTEKVIKMRRPTPEERESVDKYVKSISKPTGVNFWTLSQESCNNVISREEALQALCKAVHKNDNTIPCPNQRISCLWNKTKVQDYAEEILKLQPIKLQQKIGHWRPIYQGDEIIDYRCSECEFGYTFGKSTYGMNYCPNCGAKMIKPQESEDKE